MLWIMHITSPRLVACLPCSQHVAVYASPRTQSTTLTSLCLAGWSRSILSTETASRWPHLAPADGWSDEFGGTSCTASFRNGPRWDSTYQLLWGDLSVFLFFFLFFCLLPVARSSHHLTVSCQFSCSAASSLWCTGSNLMFFSRGGWGGVGSLPRYWRSFLCWTYLWPDFYLFSVTFIHISFHLKIFLFFGLFLHLKGLFFGSNMLKVACFGEGDFRPSLLASLVWHTWEIDNTP